MSSSLANMLPNIQCWFLLLPFSNFQLKFSFKLMRNKGVYYTKWKTMKHASQKILWLSFTTWYFNLKQFLLIVNLLTKEFLLIIWKAKTQPSNAQWTLPQAEQLYGLSPVCLILCFTNFRCILNDFPHSSQVNTLSAVWVFLCSFKLLKLLKPRKIWQTLRLKWLLTFQSIKLEAETLVLTHLCHRYHTGEVFLQNE